MEKPMSLRILAAALLALATLPAIAASEPPACEELRKDLKRVDAAARQRSSTSLTERRRKIVEKLRELGCSEGGFR